MSREDRLLAYRELTLSAAEISDWQLDEHFHIVETDCTCPEKILPLIATEAMQKIIHDEFAGSHALIYSIQSILYLIVVMDEKHHMFYIKGPFYVNPADDKSLALLTGYFGVAKEESSSLEAEMRRFPVISSSVMFQDAQMLYYAVHEQKIAVRDLSNYNQQITHTRYDARSKADQFDKVSGRWNIEQEILYKVRNGDTDVTELMSRASASAHRGASNPGKALYETKRSADQLLTLISRAAVDGGLPQKTSFSLCTAYRKQLDRCQSVGETAMLSNDMLMDYIQRVRRMKPYAKCSAQIRLCIDYIDNHLDEKITLQQLAKKTGYTNTYLSKLFYEQTGFLLIDFIQKEKIERAKFELTHTGRTIEDISYDLGFTTRSYFSTVFRKLVHMSPREYKERFEEF